MSDAPHGLALAAGMLATVNPCGFALLPAYLSFLVTGDSTPGRGAAVGRALAATAAMTAGFGAVFGVFGPLIAPIAGRARRLAAGRPQHAQAGRSRRCCSAPAPPWSTDPARRHR